MEKLQLVVDFLLTHKMLFTTLILFFYVVGTSFNFVDDSR